MSEIPKKLIKLASEKKLVLFIGAGLSISAGLPNWNNLVIEILRKLKDKEEKSAGYIAAINDQLFTPLEVLSKIEHLKSSTVEALHEIFQHYSNNEPSECHKILSDISSKIITTNYDQLIEKSITDFEIVNNSNVFKIAKLSSFEKYLFKIHGDINEPQNCILFPSQYQELYSQRETSSVFKIKNILSENSILFIGFGLSDPYINYIMEYVNSVLSGFTPEHFIITTDKNINVSERITPIQLKSYDQLNETLEAIIISKNNKVQEIIQPISKSDEFVVSSNNKLEFDLPPVSKYWVGRNKEIENIGNPNFKVICITGIGGQGKSALAAQYINHYFNNDNYEFGDWRDFKEESNRFHTKLISIIQRLTHSTIEASTLDKLNTKELVERFFHYLGKRRIVFVFDNIDSYIDLDSFKPTGGVGELFEKSLEINHNSKFIFTCRPFIKEAGINFYQVQLKGLSFIESLDLFGKYEISAKQFEIRNFCSKAHK